MSDRIEDVFRSIKGRREAFDKAFLPFCGENKDAARETLYAFGQGMKSPQRSP